MRVISRGRIGVPGIHPPMNWRGIALLWAALAILAAASAADAIQASGSLALIPQKQTGLVVGEVFTVDVYVINTSTDEVGSPVSAVVRGPLRVDKGLVDCAGTEQRPKALGFEPGPAAGCVAKADGVTRCEEDTSGSILIQLDPVGILLSAEPAFVATIALRNLLPELPVLGLRASVGACALEACETFSPRTNCKGSSAASCTFVAGISPQGEGCDRQCKGSIEYRGAELDRLLVKGEVKVGYDSSRSVKIELGGEAGSSGRLAEISIPGGIPRSGAGFVVTGPGNSNTPGINLIRLTPRKNGSLFVELDYFGNLRAAQSYMPLYITFGSDRLTFFEYWKPRPGGRGWVIRKAP